jgi:DNA-binding SARP family transcriptional activator/tetratricopeptide (TPR) repeat protein
MAAGEQVEVLHVSLLGEQAITDDRGGGVRARSSRAVVLVAFLVVHAGTSQARQRIAGLFWPESTDAQALTNLRRELHHLRQVLGDEPSLEVTSRALCWRDTKTCRVDVRVFDIERKAALAAVAAGDNDRILRHATAAIAAYRGELLPGVYDDWLLDARSQLERQCADLCDVACAARVRTGDLSGAVEAARCRIQLQPLEEVGYRTLMELQAELGDRAGAVSTYHHCASVLERDLGVAPDPSTRRAFQRLMAHVRPTEPPPVPADPGVRGPWLAAARLFGRSAELGVLQDAWRAAVAEGGGLVLVRGGAGVGKTRLVAEFAEVARSQGAVVAMARCFGTAGRLALAPVADWLRNHAVQSAVATLDPVWRAEVGRLIPARADGDRRTSPRATPDAWQRHRFFEGLARALIAVHRPLLLVLDNVQWCDQETLAFITFCLGLADDAQLLVAATVREDNLDQDAELAGWIVRMRATGLLTEISLSPLEAADTADLAEAVSGQRLPEADADLLHAATGGFPLYVIEALRGTAAAGSTLLPAGDLTMVLRKRLEQGTPAAREVADLAAAVGTNFTLDLLTEASDLGADAVVDAIDELWRRRIVREFRNGYDFSHDLLRETAYAAVSPPRRWLLHRRIAQGLELLHTENTDSVAAHLAEQYARAGRPERAVAYYQRAADAAAGMFAHAEEIHLHEKALSIITAMPPGRDRDSRELAVLEAMVAPLNARYGYSSPDVQQALERWITLAESLGRTDSRVVGLAALAGALFVRGHPADSHRTATRALDLADPQSQLAGQAHFGAGCSAFSRGMPADGLRHLELAARLAGGAVWLSFGTRPDVHGTAFSAHAHWLLGHQDEALAACREAITLAQTIDHPYSQAVALAYGSITHQLRHDLPELRSTVDELRRLCDQYDFAYYREWALILDGWSREGASGADLVRRGIGNLKSVGAFARMPYWLSLLADLSARDCRPGAARATLDAALAAGRLHHDIWWLPEVMRMRAAYDDEQAAIARLLSAAKTASEHGSVMLLRRCERDLDLLGVRLRAAGVPPTA